MDGFFQNMMQLNAAQRSTATQGTRAHLRGATAAPRNPAAPAARRNHPTKLSPPARCQSRPQTLQTALQLSAHLHGAKAAHKVDVQDAVHAEVQRVAAHVPAGEGDGVGAKRYQAGQADSGGDAGVGQGSRCRNWPSSPSFVVIQPLPLGAALKAGTAPIQLGAHRSLGLARVVCLVWKICRQQSSGRTFRMERCIAWRARQRSKHLRESTTSLAAATPATPATSSSSSNKSIPVPHTSRCRRSRHAAPPAPGPAGCWAACRPPRKWSPARWPAPSTQASVDGRRKGAAH